MILQFKHGLETVITNQWTITADGPHGLVSVHYTRKNPIGFAGAVGESVALIDYRLMEFSTLLRSCLREGYAIMDLTNNSIRQRYRVDQAYKDQTP